MALRHGGTHRRGCRLRGGAHRVLHLWACGRRCGRQRPAAQAEEGRVCRRKLPGRGQARRCQARCPLAYSHGAGQAPGSGQERSTRCAHRSAGTRQGRHSCQSRAPVSRAQAPVGLCQDAGQECGADQGVVCALQPVDGAPGANANEGDRCVSAAKTWAKATKGGHSARISAQSDGGSEQTCREPNACQPSGSMLFRVELDATTDTGVRAHRSKALPVTANHASS